MRATNFEELWSIEHTDAKGKRIKYKPKRQHREDAEWLNLEICYEYMKKAAKIGISGDVGAKRDLRIELQNRCDITEVEAVNILNGRNFKEYVHNYDIMRGKVEGGYAMTTNDYALLDKLAKFEQELAEMKMIEEDNKEF